MSRETCLVSLEKRLFAYLCCTLLLVHILPLAMVIWVWQWLAMWVNGFPQAPSPMDVLLWLLAIEGVLAQWLQTGSPRTKSRGSKGAATQAP